VLLADLVATSQSVGATPKRSEKVAALAALLRSLAPEEIEPAVGFLTGEPHQGRIGVGWATMMRRPGGGADSGVHTVGDLDRLIDQIAATTGAGSQAARQRLLDDFLAQATEDEGWFVTRLMTGELRQGALAGVMSDAVAKAAGVPLAGVRRAAMLSGDLGHAAAVALCDGESALDEIGLTVLRAVQPMLAATSATVAEALAATGAASVEWKLDGARVQVHRKGDEVRVFTRNLNDVTARLPLVVAATRSLPVESVVLDGEAIGFADDGRPRIFQDTMSRFGSDVAALEKAGAAADLRPFFFDVLHVDGEDLLDRPLGERLDVLERIAAGWRLPAISTDDAAQAEEFADGALAAGHEGVMVKALDSTYEAGRRGGSWRKVKPVKTLDLVVLAAEWGHGRRTGWLSNLHLGARGPDGGFVMVGKTFKGLTDELLTWQTDALLAREERRTTGTVWVRPELVVEIALDGVQISRRYPGGVALRFARVRGYRPDKDPVDADTIETVRGLL
jgi:DNA ligase-1